MHGIETELENVEGWLHPREGRLLFALARRCEGRGDIVEIGSWKGKSTIWLSRGSQAGNKVKVHAIDPHTGSPEHSKMFGKVWTFEEFKRNITRAGVAETVEAHVDYSTIVARTFKEPVELIFIDGQHEYDGVKADFKSWFPKVIAGGTMAFHDTTCWPGVLRVVSEDVFKSRRFRKVRFRRSIVYGEKANSNTLYDRFENRVVWCAFLIHAWKDRMIWRLIHRHLDCALTRAAVNYFKRKKTATPVSQETKPVPKEVPASVSQPST